MFFFADEGNLKDIFSSYDSFKPCFLNFYFDAICQYLDVQNANTPSEFEGGYTGEEGSADGLEPQGSLAFAVLEVALCILVRQASSCAFRIYHLVRCFLILSLNLQMPQLNAMLMNKKVMTSIHYRKYSRLPAESNELIKVSLLYPVKSK